jgi:hypothetical protein
VALLTSRQALAPNLLARKTFKIHIDDGVAALIGGAEQWLTNLWPMTY